MSAHVARDFKLRTIHSQRFSPAVVLCKYTTALSFLNVTDCVVSNDMSGAGEQGLEEQSKGKNGTGITRR